MTNAKPLTGRKVFLITAAAFGVIIGVNMVMMFSAIGTFPGLEVQNSYVASQQFNAKATAQRALGWTPVFSYEKGQVTLEITQTDGSAVFPATVNVLVGRPTEAKDDQTLPMVRTENGYVAEAALPDGMWRVYFDATTADGTEFSTRMELFVRN